MKHILKVLPDIGNYIITTDWINKVVTHRVPHITLDALPREKLAGILWSKIEIYPGTKIEPEALSWVLSALRDIKDEPSGIGN